MRTCKLREPKPPLLAALLSLVLSVLFVASARAQGTNSNAATTEPPTEWIEPSTGHRVVRLSREPGSLSLYFHQNAYSADGKKLVITTPGGISTIDLKTREIIPVVQGQGRVNVLVTGRKTGQIYYIRSNVVFATDLDTKSTHEVAKLPPDVGQGNVTINADETLIVGIGRDPDGKPAPRTPPPGETAGGRLGPTWSAGTPKMIYTINIKTGEVKVIHRENDWTNHLQCSPTDPMQIMFCHEGNWQWNDRVWTIRTDGTDLRLMHPRTMNMEIAGHEFFSGDGKRVWYDLQTPRSLVFWLGGVELATGHRTWYNVQRNEWSVHYNVSPDGKLFAGDGGGPSSVAAHLPGGASLDTPGNGQWIYLFHPVLVAGKSGPIMADGKPITNTNDLIQTGYFKSERLVDLSKHDYTLEPNVTFTPDGKWIVFRSNMFGPSHVFAVEVAKAK